LGHGGFADVFLYTQATPRRDVAIKVLHSSMAGTEAASRLDNEADAMAGLSQHQNIVTVFQSGVAADGRAYLVMEYYPGPALSQGLRQSQRSLANSLKIGIQLAGALESAHRIRVPGSTTQGILHRDIKPANILTDRWGRPVLGDFGIAMTNAEAERGGAQGMSIPWSPPESFDKDPHPTRQSDVWSLAATVYALLAGRPPFEVPGGNNQAHAMIDRIRNAPYQPLGRVDAPASLDQVLSTAMAKSPAARYASMKAFGLALREVETELGLPPTGMDILDDTPHDTGFGGGDDDVVGTSLRPITLIDPTGATGAGWPTAAPGPVLPDIPLDRTQTRRDIDPTQLRPMVMASPVPAPAVVTPEPAAQPSSWWRIVVAVVVVVVIAGAVTIAVLLGKGGTPTGTNEATGTPTANPQDPGGKTQIPPAPENLAGTVDAASATVVFTWTNPDPQPGDQYRWTIVGSPDNVKFTADTEVTVPQTAGQPTCINVMTIRSGAGSAEVERCAA
jgi:serine/threonine protein kinase